MEDHGRDQQLGRHEPGPGTGLGLRLRRLARLRLLRGQPQGGQPFRQLRPGAGRLHRGAEMALPDRPPRRLGLRPSVPAGPDQHDPGGTDFRGGGPAHQDGNDLFLRSGDGRTGLPRRGAAHARLGRSRRGAVADPALSGEAPSPVPAGVHARTRSPTSPPKPMPTSRRSTTAPASGPSTLRPASRGPSSIPVSGAAPSGEDAATTRRPTGSS